jgi:hypothetical protein
MLEPYRRPSTKVIPPVPTNFARNFIEGGWRKVERMYGQRDDLLIKWKSLAGGQALDDARTAYRFGRMTFDQAFASLQPSAVSADAIAA